MGRQNDYVGITVAIPVGPFRHSQRYLVECLASVGDQTVKPDEVLVIDDMANLSDMPEDVRIWQAPWRLGVASAFNMGVALAKNNLVIMLGADDRLFPRTVERCLEAWRSHWDALGYYYMDVRYSDGEEQSLACNGAMVTKQLWRHTGGFPPETGIGAPDSALISILLAHPGAAGNLHRVPGGCLYWARRHPDQDTASRGPYQGSILEVRNILTEGWTPPIWGRYAL